jgi:hypothetical protein
MTDFSDFRCQLSLRRVEYELSDDTSLHSEVAKAGRLSDSRPQKGMRDRISEIAFPV